MIGYMQEFTLGIIFKTKITVTDDIIRGGSTMTKWSFARTSITGYRLTSKQIYLYDADDKNLKAISRNSGSDNFISWLKDNYPDLDKVFLEKEESEILANETFGHSEEERNRAYIHAKRTTYVLTGIAAAIFIGQFLTDTWQWLLFCCAFVVPLAGAVFYRQRKGLIRIIGTKGGAYPALWGAYTAALLYFLISFVSRHTLDMSPLTSYVAVTAGAGMLVFFVITWETMRHERQSQLVIAGMVIYFILLAYFSIGGANCIFDKAQPVRYSVEVIGKRISRGSRSKSYYMKLQPWGPIKAIKEISISSAFYDRLSPGDTITTMLYPGALGMQWYKLEGD